jgi:hypothetical protein
MNSAGLNNLNTIKDSIQNGTLFNDSNNLNLKNNASSHKGSSR